jgi:hypothetical protein
VVLLFAVAVGKDGVVQKVQYCKQKKRYIHNGARNHAAMRGFSPSVFFSFLFPSSFTHPAFDWRNGTPKWGRLFFLVGGEGPEMIIAFSLVSSLCVCMGLKVIGLCWAWSCSASGGV